MKGSFEVNTTALERCDGYLIEVIKQAKLLLPNLWAQKLLELKLRSHS